MTHTINNDRVSAASATSTQPACQATKVGIVGGGTAGSTIAIRLAALGIQTYLFEQKPSLIDGPPMCHLHAGGNLYREISDDDCVALLKQCVDMVRLYPYTIDVRPTVFAVPIYDKSTPQDLLPRLQRLQQVYADLVAKDKKNQVLGEPDDYFKLYEKNELAQLAQQEQIKTPTTTDEWLIPVAKYLNLDKVKFPLIVVQEYGWNIFRMAASATLALQQSLCAQVYTHTQVIKVEHFAKSEEPYWQIEYQSKDDPSQNDCVQVDFLVNACGFRTGIIDDMAAISAERMVEFKSSYITQWQANDGQLPEIIIYGERGTPQGMAQLTPYPDGYYQIHGMSKDITLFNDGLVASTDISAQPTLPQKYIQYIDKGWNLEVLNNRSQRAIDFVAQFVPAFSAAAPTGNALYGGQQIPGNDDTLRVADISIYPDKRYARAENVKASSALIAADELVKTLAKLQLITPHSQQAEKQRWQHQWQYLTQVDSVKIDDVATHLATERQYPPAMATVNNGLYLPMSTI